MAWLPRWRAAILVSGAAVSLTAADAAAAATAAEERLARAYSPIVMLRAQEDPPCDNTEEQYQPTTVDVVLGNPQVQLVTPAERGKPGKSTRGPTAADLAGRGANAYLDLPGNPLDPGCSYAKRFRAIKRAGRAPPITYAHIARQRGQPGLVLQYWFFYWFNQFNDLHEADWEGMQLVFEASSVRGALAEGPSEVGLFQRAGGERGDWDDDKVEK